MARALEDDHGTQQTAYALAIKEAVSRSDLRNVVEVKVLQRKLPSDPDAQHASALKIGRWLNASFVLRPYVVEGVQTPWLTIVQQPAFSANAGPLTKFASKQLAYLDKAELPNDILLLSRCALAYSLERGGKNEEAAKEFKAILASSALPEIAPSRADLRRDKSL